MTTELASGTQDGRKWRIFRESGRLFWERETERGTSNERPHIDLNEAPWVLALLHELTKADAAMRARDLAGDESRRALLALHEEHKNILQNCCDLLSLVRMNPAFSMYDNNMKELVLGIRDKAEDLLYRQASPSRKEGGA